MLPTLPSATWPQDAMREAILANLAALDGPDDTVVAPGVVYRHDRCVTNFGSLRCMCGRYGLIWAWRKES